MKDIKTMKEYQITIEVASLSGTLLDRKLTLEQVRRLVELRSALKLFQEARVVALADSKNPFCPSPLKPPVPEAVPANQNTPLPKESESVGWPKWSETIASPRSLAVSREQLEPCKPCVAGLWRGETSRSLALRRPCSCGCDRRSNPNAVGVFSGSLANGDGFSIVLESEELYQRIRAVIKEQGLPM